MQGPDGDVEVEEEDSGACDVADQEGTRILSEQCGTCILRAGTPVPPQAVRRVIRSALEADGHVVCHETAVRGVPAAVCRGFVDRYGDQALSIRLAHVIGIREIPPPSSLTSRF